MLNLNSSKKNRIKNISYILILSIILSILPACKLINKEKTISLSAINQQEICELIASLNITKTSIKDVTKDDSKKCVLATYLVLLDKNLVKTKPESTNPGLVCKSKDIQTLLQNAIDSKISSGFVYKLDDFAAYNENDGLMYNSTPMSVKAKNVDATYNSDSDISITGEYSFIDDTALKMTDIKFSATAKQNKNSKYFGGLTFKDYKITSEKVVSDDEGSSENNSSSDNSIPSKSSNSSSTYNTVECEGKKCVINQDVISMLKTDGYNVKTEPLKDNCVYCYTATKGDKDNDAAKLKIFAYKNEKNLLNRIAKEGIHSLTNDFPFIPYIVTEEKTFYEKQLTSDIIGCEAALVTLDKLDEYLLTKKDSDLTITFITFDSGSKSSIAEFDHLLKLFEVK